MDQMEFDRGNPQEDAPRRVQKRKKLNWKPVWFAVAAAVLAAVLLVASLTDTTAFDGLRRSITYARAKNIEIQFHFDKAKNTASLTKATFGNCILYNKNGGNALAFEKNDAAAFNYLFDTNIIRNGDTSKLNVTTAPNFLASITLDPMFVNTDYTANKLAVKKESPAKGKGKLTFAQQYPLDYNGQPRGTTPTIGALQ